MQVKDSISAAGHLIMGVESYRAGIRRATAGDDGGVPVSDIMPGDGSSAEASPPESELEKTVQHLTEYVGWGNFTIEFKTDDQTGSMVISIIDRDTGEILRQIPPEQILKLKSRIREMLGLVFDHMA